METKAMLNALVTAIKFLGTTSILLIIGLVLCFLAVIGYNTYIKYQNKHKKIEVRSKNSNSKKKIK